MQITNDVSLGTIITVIITVSGFLLAAGRTAALLQQMTRYVNELRADYNAHILEDTRRFDGLSASLNDAAVKQAAVSATVTAMSSTVSAIAAAQSYIPRPQEAQ